MENAFNFTVKALFVLEVSRFLTFDEKTKVNVKFTTLQPQNTY